MTESGIKWYKGKFANVFERHENQKRLLLINVSYKASTETSAIQDMMLESMDFGGVKYLAVRVDLDTAGAKLRLLESHFPDAQIENNCVILVGFYPGGQPKEYDPIRDTTDLAGAISPILEEYKAFYAKFRQEHPDFKSDNEEDVEEEVEEVDNKTFEEKKQELVQAIAKKRAEKEELEKAEALAAEIKRREAGKKQQEVEELLRQEQMKRDIAQRQKQKADDAAYLNKMREEMRREREAKRAASQSSTPSTSIQESSIPTSSAPVSNVSDKAECKICYQFPNGTRVVKIFPSVAKFRDVFDAIKDDSNISGNYQLFTTFPRKPIESYDKNLIELSLTPASVLAVVSKNEAEKQIVNQGFGYVKNAAMMIITLICGPLASLFQFFSLLFGFRVENPNEHSESEQRIHRQAHEQRRRGGGNRRNFKKDGNIQGLGDNDSTDDEGTWNGNSTQQL